MDEENEDLILTKKEQWEKEHDTGMQAGICSQCGSKIFQSTYTDSCMCGDSDYAY